MKKIWLSLILTGIGWGQTAPYNIQIAQQPLPAVGQVVANYTGGTPGQTFNNYVVIAKYGVGNAIPSNPVQVNNITVGSGSVVISWTAPANPTGTALTYDVIRLPNGATFGNNGACINCFLFNATSNTTVTDNLASLAGMGYTLNAYNPIPANMTMSLDNIDATTVTLKALLPNGTNLIPPAGSVASTTNALVGNGVGGAIAASGAGTNCVLVNGSSATCGSGGSSAFNAITSGTNTTAAMVVGSGGTLAVSGSGTIAATTAAALAATPAQCGGSTFATGITANGTANCGTPAGAGTVTTTGSPTANTVALISGATSITNSNMTQNAGDGSFLASKAIDWNTANSQTNAGGTTTLDLSLSNSYIVTASAAAPTIAVSNPHGSGPWTVKLINDTTARVWAFPGTFQNACSPGAASTYSIQEFTFDGTNYNGKGCTLSEVGVIRSAEAAILSKTTTTGNGVAGFDTTAHLWCGNENASSGYNCDVPAGTGVTAGDVIDYAAGGIPQDSGVLLSALTRTICSGTIALGTGAITTASAASTVTATCTGLASTDVIQLTSNVNIFGVTGYAPSASGILTISDFPTTNTINVVVVNNTAGTITPGALTLNYRVTR